MFNPRQMKKIILISMCLVAFLAVFNVSLQPPKTDSGARPSAALFKPATAHAQAYNFGDPSQVTKTLGNKDKSGEWVYTIYKICRGFFNVILLIVLILVALANILHLKIETYGIKKMIVPLLVATVFANVAMPIFVVASRVVDTIQTLKIFHPSSIDLFYITRGMSLGTTGGVWAIMSAIGIAIAGTVSGLSCCFGVLVFLGAVIIIIALGLILAFRPYIVYLTAAISPLAIACSIIPQTQQYFKKWLNVAIVWMVMPIVIYGLVNIGYLIPGNTSGSASGFIAGVVGFFLPALLRAGLLLLAIRFPFTIEKDISGLIGTVSKGAGKMGMTLGGTGADVIYKQTKAAQKNIFTKELGKRYAETMMNDDTRDRIDKKKDEIKDHTRFRSITDPVQKDAAIEQAARGIVGREVFKESLEAAKEKQNVFNASTSARAFRGLAGLISAPLGISIAIKNNKETMQKERDKSSQKVLANTASQWAEGLVDKKKSVWGRWAAQPDNNWLIAKGKEYLSPEMILGSKGIRGPLHDLKYFEEIAKADIADHDRDQIRDYMGEAYKDAMENMQKIYPDMSPEKRALALQATLNHLMGQAEGIALWSQMDAVRGMSDNDIGGLTAGTYKMRQEISKEARGYGGLQVARIREGEVDREFLGELLRASAPPGAPAPPGATTPGLGGGGGAPVDEREKEENSRTEAYLQKIAEQTGKLSGLDKIREAVLTASQTGVTDLYSKRMQVRSANSLENILRTLKAGGFNDDEIETAREELDSPDVSVIENAVARLKPRLGKPEEAGLLDNHLNLAVAHKGALANSEDAQSIGRYVTEITPRLDENAIPGVLAACDTAFKFKMELDPQISPAQFQQSLQTIRTVAPSAVMEKINADGTKTLDTAAASALKVGKAIETTRVEPPPVNPGELF